MKHMTLRAARAKAKLTVSELARRCAISRLTIQRLERGRVLPAHETREALERELSKALRELITLDFRRQSVAA